MTDFVLNEWIWEDVRGVNGTINESAALRLLGYLLSEGVDRFVLLEGTQFHEKLLYFVGHSVQRESRRIAQLVISGIFDSSKCIKLPENSGHDVNAALLEDMPRKDTYLVCAQYCVPGSIIVTSDGRFIEKLRKYDIPHEHRDVFIPRFLQAHK